jgi:hypothetical protein
VRPKTFSTKSIPQAFLKDPLQVSLATLVAQIEEMVPELDQDKKDIDSTQTRNRGWRRE